MKNKLRKHGLRMNGASTGALLIFLVLCLGTGLGTIPNLLNSTERFAVVGEFGGQNAFAGEQDMEEAMVDSFLDDDTLIVVSDSAAPGDSFWLTINMVSTIPIYGFDFAFFDYDTLIIFPDTFAIVDTTYDTLTPPYIFIDTTWYPTFELLGRANRPDTAFFLLAASFWNQHLDTLRFSCVVDFIFAGEPPIDPGSGPVVRFKFWVREDAQPGGTTPIRFVDALPVPGADTPPNFTDILGNFLIPMTRDGTFTVADTTEPTNHCPVFTAPLASSFPVNQGTTLEFDVTATDEDGDSITLSLEPLDLVGQTTWNFDTKKGDSVVTQRFEYTPGFDVSPGIKNIRFWAVDDSGCSVPKEVSIEVIETAQDLLIASSLQGGVPGARDRLTPFIITNSVDIYGFQFTFRWDPARLYVDSLVATDVLEGFVVYDNRRDSVEAGNTTVLVFGLGGETIPAGLDTVIYPAFRVLEEAEPGPVDITIENAREAINPGYPSQPLGAVDGIFMIDRFGDANLDQWVDVGDVVSLVAYITNSISFTPRQESAADVNQDSAVDVGDLVAMIDIILGRWMGPAPPMYPGPMAFVELDCQDLQAGSSGEIRVMANLEVPVAAAQLQINYDPEQVSFQVPALSERSGHFLIQHRDDGKGKLRVVLFNMSNDPITVGEGNILSLPVTLSPGTEDDFGIELKEVALADEKAVLIPVGDAPSRPVAFELGQNYPNPFNPSTTIKFTLPSPRDGGAVLPTNLKIYNVLGEVVKTLVDEPMAPGVHHKVWDGRDDQGSRVASGIYFYRLRSGDFQHTKKMVLMK